MRTSACFGGKLKNFRRYHSSKNKKKIRDRVASSFGCQEVRIVDLNVPTEISLSLFYVQEVTHWRKWRWLHKYFVDGHPQR